MFYKFVASVREILVFTYPDVEYNNEISIMSIYADNATDQYEDEYKLCEIHGTTSLNGQITRLTFNYKLIKKFTMSLFTMEV